MDYKMTNGQVFGGNTHQGSSNWSGGMPAWKERQLREEISRNMNAKKSSRLPISRKR